MAPLIELPLASICRRIISACCGFRFSIRRSIKFFIVPPIAYEMGMPRTKEIAAPIAPAIAPSTAPSPGVAGVGELLTYKYEASMPPRMAQRQQQRLIALTKGITESTPRQTPPISAGRSLLFIAPVLAKTSLDCQ